MGCTLALELAQRGYLVKLFDKSPFPMNKTSLHNEGKLHLGFVYANDPTANTHKLMAQGSLSFLPILARLTGSKPEEFGASSPFHYFIPADSQITIDQIGKHFEKVASEICLLNKDTENDYFGIKSSQWFERNPANVHEQLFAATLTQGSFKTEERSVSTRAVAEILSAAIGNHPNISFMGNSEILSVRRLDSGDINVNTLDRTEKQYTFPCVVNCLWDDRLRIDRSIGLEDQGSWYLRYKASITFKVSHISNPVIPSATGILGPYGDIVSLDDHYYVSWYPLAKRAEMHGQNGRELSNGIHNKFSRRIQKIGRLNHKLTGVISSFAHRKFVRDSVKAISDYVPSAARLMKMANSWHVGGGVIMARGKTDIDDPNSHLHQRSAIGPKTMGSYISVDTGKYCMGPFFAVKTANLIKDIL